jgi:acid phosphatase family membrane protein YuiD
MNLTYLITPFLAWLVTGAIKFFINSLRASRLAFNQIGYGGMPSNHSAIASSIAMLIALNEGIQHPAFGLAIAFLFIVVLDAHSLRGQIGKHAAAINRLEKECGIELKYRLREKIGHSKVEILAGLLCGAIVALAVHFIRHHYQ